MGVTNSDGDPFVLAAMVATAALAVLIEGPGGLVLAEALAILTVTDAIRHRRG